MKKYFLQILQKSLGFFAKMYLKKSNPIVIGITGSVGKTSCRIIITQTLKQLCNNKTIYTSPKNFNSELGIVFSIFEIEDYSPGISNLLLISIKIIIKTIFTKGKYDILLLEYGIDKPDDMDFLLNIVIPDISIFTKLDSIHLENFKNINDIGKEKFKLMKMTKKLVYLNFKDEYCRNNYYGILSDKKLYDNGELKAINYKININTTKNSETTSNNKTEILSSFELNSHKIKTNILGEENINYIVVGVDILKYLSKSGIKTNILGEENINLNYKLQPGRFSIFNGINNSILIDSSYNAGPESMKKMIENTIKLKENIFSTYKIGYILGDMRELGEKSDKFHEEIEKITKEADLIYTVGKEMKKNFKTENNFLSSKEAGLKLKTFLSNTSDKYIILFKGSQNTIFIEETLKQVLKNKTDINKLVRQNTYWIKKKETYFGSL